VRGPVKPVPAAGSRSPSRLRSRPRAPETSSVRPNGNRPRSIWATVAMRLPAWYAALDEVKGHRALVSSDTFAACDHFRTAAAGFGASGQPLDELAAEISRRVGGT
jgi:hypothetical protein